MIKSTFVRTVLLASVMTALSLPGGLQGSASIVVNLPQPRVSGYTETGVGSSARSAAPDALSTTSTFYSIRPDLRRCASPRCGGFFVKRVNLSSTRCANGRFMNECYVAEIDWHLLTQVDPARALIRGNIVLKRIESFDNLGVLSVTESWQAAGDNKPAGTFYRVRDRGLRCITSPCPTHHEAKLNSTLSRNIAGVDFSGAGAAESEIGTASAAMTGPDGILVAGSHASVTGPAGKAETLKATQFYLRAGESQASKPCVRGGCSNQACADHPVITTCEWRPEYACYQKAACERQADGNCGFTKTPELTACLARVRR